ncbi:DNA repair and recombination protein RadB [Candidatus Woesearchaeota archaeon]|nr:DNA repair and recombination protein RadB [Candidatus Woesearchaeota archaeon]
MKISTGSQVLNTFLNGGYENDILTTIYGPSGSGKTNLCLLAAVKIAEQGKKVLLIDTEGGIAVDRVQQLTNTPQEVLKNLLFFNPVNFDEQKAIFETLRDLVNEEVGLIIVDSISMLYRLEMGKSDEVYEVNSALGKQISYLVEIARRRKIPVLITNQVYSDFDKRGFVKMVGGDFLKYGSKCLIELCRTEDERKLVLRKHRSLPEGKELLFKIISKGIEEI